jgi:hypothetical protein
MLRASIILGSLLLIFIFLFNSTRTGGQIPNSNSSESDIIIRQIKNTNIQFENHTVYLSVWLLNTYSFEYTTGNYIFDMYVSILWIDPNISKNPNWYFTNGYAYPTPEANVLLNLNVSGDIKYKVYRVTAALNTPPNAKDYPFDKISLKISMDISVAQEYNINGKWINNLTIIDPYFENAGWKTTDVELLSSMHASSLGVERPHFDMVITQEKIRPSSIITTFLPPIFFCIVSAISFLFNLKGLTPVSVRIGLNNSMLVTTLLFIISVGGSIPPSSVMSIFEMFMLSVLSFLILGLVVTVMGFAFWIRYKNEKKTLRINRWGFIISIIAPLLLFTVLYFLRG